MRDVGGERRREPDESVRLLEEYQRGRASALHELVERNLGWIHGRVRKRLGAKLRVRLESSDVVQDSVVEFLRYGPRLRVDSEAQLRGVLARIVETTLQDKDDWFRARRRSASREQHLAQQDWADLSQSGSRSGALDEEVHRRESVALLRLGIELLSPSERQVIVLRRWDGLSFREVGAQLGIGPEAARKRFERAIQSLTLWIRRARNSAGEGLVERGDGSIESE